MKSKQTHFEESLSEEQSNVGKQEINELNGSEANDAPESTERGLTRVREDRQSRKRDRDVIFHEPLTPAPPVDETAPLARGSIDTWFLLWAMLLIALGLIDVYYNRSLTSIVTGCVAAGFGYGMAQPYIYDKTSSAASPQKVTYALALLMSMNYVAIVIAPFITDWAQDILGIKGERFPFMFNAVIGFAALGFMLLLRVYDKRSGEKYE